MICRVYRNLHNGKYSIQARTGKFKGKVIGHADAVIMESVDFKVSENGRQRVLKEKKKNVHAFVEGDLLAVRGISEFNNSRIMYSVPAWPLSVYRGDGVTYNPYKYNSFVYSDTKAPIASASRVVLDNQGIHLSGAYDAFCS